jgi:hypothetical protein
MGWALFDCISNLLNYHKMGKVAQSGDLFKDWHVRLQVVSAGLDLRG